MPKGGSECEHEVQDRRKLYFLFFSKCRAFHEISIGGKHQEACGRPVPATVFDGTVRSSLAGIKRSPFARTTSKTNPPTPIRPHLYTLAQSHLYRLHSRCHEMNSLRLIRSLLTTLLREVPYNKHLQLCKRIRCSLHLKAGLHPARQ